MTIESEQMDANIRSINSTEIGAILASSRRNKNISLQELSDSLRIPKMYLKYLENSDFSNLPGIAYVPGYIRSYCKATGIDSGQLVAAYIASVEEDESLPIYDVPGQALVPKLSKSSIAMITILLVVFGYTAWFVFLRDEPDQIASTPILPENAPVEMESSDVANSELYNSESKQISETIKSKNIESTALDSSMSSSTQTAQISKNITSNVEEISVNEEIKNENKLQIVDKTFESETQTAKIEDLNVLQNKINPSDSQNGLAFDQIIESSNPSSAVAKGIELSDTLTIKATASSWIEMVNSNGDVITSKLLRPGDSVAANLGDNLYFTTGNAGALIFELIDVPAFKIGKIGEIIRDLPLSADSIISRKFD